MEQRAQRRTKAMIPVRLSGTDARGEIFEETLEAQDVSRRGLSVLTRRDLAVSSTISIVIPGRGRFQPGQGRRPSREIRRPQPHRSALCWRNARHLFR